MLTFVPGLPLDKMMIEKIGSYICRDIVNFGFFNKLPTVIRMMP